MCERGVCPAILICADGKSASPGVSGDHAWQLGYQPLPKIVPRRHGSADEDIGAADSRYFSLPPSFF